MTNEKDTRIKMLEKALEAAYDHLLFCDYGDSWERECAEAQGLESQITKALNKE